MVYPDDYFLRIKKQRDFFRSGERIKTSNKNDLHFKIGYTVKDT